MIFRKRMRNNRFFKNFMLVLILLIISCCILITRLSKMHYKILYKDKNKDKNLRLDMQHVSMVLSNHVRPKNIKKIINAAVGYTIINEIILWDDFANPEQLVQFNHTKVSIIRAKELRPMEKWGLLGRFKWALLAQNENILIQDDDQMLSEKAILKMVHAKINEPDRLVCYIGRSIVGPTTDYQVSYIIRDVPNNVYAPVCLTKSVLTDRRFCLEAIRHAHLIENIAKKGQPYWNGEDIWHSLTAIKTTGLLHIVLPNDRKEYRNLPAPHGIGDRILNSTFNHGKYRKEFTRKAVERLGLKPKDLYLQPTGPRLKLLKSKYVPSVCPTEATTYNYRGNTSICIVSQFSGKHCGYAEIAVANHRAYAEEHGYTYSYYMGRISGDEFVDSERGSINNVRGGGHHWQKLTAVSKMFDKYGTTSNVTLCKWIVWADSDIIFSNFKYKLEYIIANFGAKKDVILSREEAGGTLINSGIFFVQNSIGGQRFIQTVSGMYHTYKYPDEFVKLHDQDAIQDFAFQQHRNTPKYKLDYDTIVRQLRTDVAIVPQRLFNSFDRDRDDPEEAAWQKCDFVAHISASSIERRYKRMKKIISTVRDCGVT